MECKRKFNLVLIKDKLTNEQKFYIQSIIERYPICPKFLTQEEIYEIKYNKFVKDFASGKYKNIIFMVLQQGFLTSDQVMGFINNYKKNLNYQHQKNFSY